jgi:redox-sensitive bicupin YhaK (pirin superfamily)
MPGRSTQPIYADIHLASGASVTLPVPEGHNAMLYLYEGTASLGESSLQLSAANILADNGDQIVLDAGEAGARLLLIAGKPIGEPVVQYGPFVMNTREEIEQTLRDYRDGRLTA